MPEKKEMTNEQALLEFQQGELDAVILYRKIAAQSKNAEVASVLREIARDEGRHAAILFKLTRETLKPKETQANMVSLLMRVMGAKALFPIIAKKEYAAFDKYAPFISEHPELAEIQQDERKHGNKIAGLVKLL